MKIERSYYFSNCAVCQQKPAWRPTCAPSRRPHEPTWNKFDWTGAVPQRTRSPGRPNRPSTPFGPMGGIGRLAGCAQHVPSRLRASPCGANGRTRIAPDTALREPTYALPSWRLLPRAAITWRPYRSPEGCCLDNGAPLLGKQDVHHAFGSADWLAGHAAACPSEQAAAGITGQQVCALRWVKA